MLSAWLDDDRPLDRLLWSGESSPARRKQSVAPSPIITTRVLSLLFRNDRCSLTYCRAFRTLLYFEVAGGAMDEAQRALEDICEPLLRERELEKVARLEAALAQASS